LSHIVEITTQIRDPAAVAAACRRLGLAEPVQRTVQLFSSTETGLAVELPGWRYPIVCDVGNGVVKFDNFAGRWGAQKEPDRFLQAYCAEVVRIEARKKGHTVTEQSIGDGSIKLTIQVQGGAA